MQGKWHAIQPMDIRVTQAGIQGDSAFYQVEVKALDDEAVLQIFGTALTIYGAVEAIGQELARYVNEDQPS